MTSQNTRAKVFWWRTQLGKAFTWECSLSAPASVRAARCGVPRGGAVEGFGSRPRLTLKLPVSQLCDWTIPSKPVQIDEGTCTPLTLLRVGSWSRQPGRGLSPGRDWLP